MQHILYNTVGNDFEKYLDGKDLITMSKVSKTTREGELNIKFRVLVEATMKEYNIFKANNSIEPSYDMFFQHIPLGIIYNNVGDDIYMLLDYLGCNSTTRLYVWIELCTLEDFRRYLDDNIPEDQVYLSLIFQANIRLRDDITELLFYYPRGTNALDYYEDYYPANERFRKLYIDRFPEHIASITDPMRFGLTDMTHHFNIFLWLTTSFQKQDIFREYYTEDGSIIPDDIEKILECTELKYNINPYHPKLMTEKQRYMESEDEYMYETYS